MESPRGGLSPRLAELAGELRAALARLVDSALQLAGQSLGVLQPMDLSPAALPMGEHRLDRAPVLALQPVDHVQTLLHQLEATGLGLDSVEVGAQGARRVVELDRGRADSRGDRVERGIDSVHGPQVRLGPSQQAACASQVVLGACDRRQRSRRGRAQALGMAQAITLGFQLTLLAGIRGGRLDLRQLEAKQVEVPLPCSFALAQLGQLTRQRHHLGVGVAVAAPALKLLGAGEAVEDLELRRGQHQPAVLVLPVEGQQPGAERPQVARRRGAPLHEGAGPPRDTDAPSEDDLVGVRGKAPAQLGQLGLGEQLPSKREDTLHVGLIGPGTDDLGARLAAHQQVERVGEDRLPRPGLAGDRVQPACEAELGTLDQQQVLDPQLVQHLVLSSSEEGRISYAAAASAAGSSLCWATKSRDRTSAKPRTAPAIATAAATIRISLSPLMNA